MKYRLWVLLIFAALEVLCYDSSNATKALVAVCEYAFVVWALAANPRVGIMYYCSFTLLALGAWSYVTNVAQPANFWGLRVAGYSVNATFTLVVAGALCARGVRAVEPPSRGITMQFLRNYTFYSLLAGSVAVLLDANYADDFGRDVIVGVLIFPYAYLVGLLATDQIRRLVADCLLVTAAMMLLSYVGGVTFEYGDRYRFLLMNAVSFVAVFAPLVLWQIHPKPVAVLFAATMFGLLASGEVFLGGKGLVIFVLALLWCTRSSVPVALAVVGVAFLLFLGGLSALERPLYLFGDDVVVLYKLVQIFDVFAVRDLHLISMTRTSMGNLVAEAASIARHFWDYPWVMMFGKGFGAAVPDVYGYLSPLTGGGAGYSYLMADRNAFARMHLPAYEIALRTGVVGVTVYLGLLVRLFSARRATAFVLFVLMLMVLTHSKEMLLLTVVFALLDDRLSHQEKLVEPLQLVVSEDRGKQPGP